MKRNLKLMIGAAAFVAPILLGAAITGDLDVGADSEDGHGAQQWTIEENGNGVYTIDRSEIGGVLTIEVTDPEGAPIEESDYPDYIAEAVAEFGSPNWQPDDSYQEDFDVVDGVACYDADKLSSELTEVGDAQTASFHLGTFVLQVMPDGSLHSAYFEDQVGDDVLHDQFDAQASVQELDGAKPLVPCEN